MRYEKLVSKRYAAGCVLAAVLILACSSAPAWGIEPKQGSALSDKEFFLPELYISSSQDPVAAVVTKLPNSQEWQDYLLSFAAAGQQPPQAYIDPRSGAATNILRAVPLIPGSGVGNQLTLDDLEARIGRSVAAVDATVVADAVRRHVLEQRTLLGIRQQELGAVRAVQVSPTLWQARIPQTYRGIPVRHGHLVATINRGNLVLMGTETWGPVRRLDTVPTFTAEDAMAAGFDYADGASPADILIKHPALEIVPIAPQRFQNGEAFDGPVGKGYQHRLVWTFAFQRPPSQESWEVMYDAHSGEVIAFQDLNQYADEQITGGVYPVTSTEICPTPGTCGEMQSGWPMPFADTGQASPNNFTNSAGVFFHTGGTATTTLSGQYVNISDNCGGISNSASGSIDMGGVNGQHDCTNAGGSAGNTPASRTAFYELNKTIEQGRGWLPGNSWLQSQLTSNVNINNTCNAFWSFGGTVNFYRSGGGCRNTGELAGVFDHEWGHGLDDNDAGGTLSNSSEAYADIAAIYRLQDSCVGHGFFETIDDGCGMTSDGTGFNSNENQVGGSHCDLDCSGVRDADWDRHADHTPDTALGFVCSSCLTSSGPCGRQVHCAAAPSRQAAWDFVARDLQAAPFNYDSQTAFLVGNKVFYQGSGNIGTWHSCTCGGSSSGCGSTNGYMQWLAADDDNGSISDGTPHMTALFDAFDRHGIACATPTPTNSGCAGGPTGAATLTATPGNKQVQLSWGSVPGATSYWVLRSEGHAGCDFGKAVIATVGGTSYTDTEVANGRDYSYNVVPVGSPDACYGGASNCETVQPVGAPDFGVSCAPASHSIQQGANAASTCTVSSEAGYTGNIGLSCSGQPAGISCAFAPASVSPPANGSADSALTISVDLGQATGMFNFDVVADDGSTTRTSGMSVNVTPEGANGPQDAVFNPTYQAPACLTPGSECDSLALVDGRANLGPEPNQPNTIADSCADGATGSYHNDESNDRIVVKTLDGSDFSEGATVQIDATVWAWSTGSSDNADFYYAADANSPSWTFIGTLPTPSGGAQTLSIQYTLPAGGLQAVRVQFRYLGSAGTCTSGAYNDRDDLVFAVNATAQCTVDADCDDGAFCNGAETCNAGTCQAGTPPACDNGLFCDGSETCNETDDVCDAGTPPACDDGLFCNGAETCNETDDVCDAGTAPTCDDGLFCNGVETCNETDDVCDPGTPPACDDGLYCNGVESCNETDDICDAGTAPTCDDGLFCNGTETCNETDDVCDPGTAPCDPGTETCDEGTDTCEPIGCTVNADCDDGLFCNGAETCDTGSGACQAGTPPACDDGLFCNGVESCNETDDVCDAGTAPTCDDGLFCNGVESCNETDDVCDAGTPPTCDDGLFCNGVESCNETDDVCDAGSPPVCEDGLFCNGVGTCNEGTDSCDPGTDPCAVGEVCDEGTDTCNDPPTGSSVWMSFRTNTAVPGVGTVTDDDIVSYDEGTGIWALEFDGSDISLTQEIDGLAVLPGGDILLSMRVAGTAGGVTFDDSDILRFTGTGGANTSGTLSLYFDGSDVGLTSNGEDVDAIALHTDGRIMVSTTGGFSGTGASGSDEDLFLFTGTLGSSTSGSFERYFDGSDVGLSGAGARDVDAAGFDASGALALSIVGNSTVGGIATSDEDVLDFTGTFGSSTSGSYSMRLDLSALGIAATEDIGSLFVVD